MLNKNTAIAASVFLILIVVFIAFSPSLKNGFVAWDDNSYVADNDSIKQLSIRNIKTIFTSSYVANYQPLSILSYALEYCFFKLSPQVYHTTNVSLHLLNCLLVFWIIMLISGRVPVSLMTTLLFGLHPLRVESVTWVAERKDVLYAFFFLWSLVSYLYYARRGRIKYYCFSLFLFLFSVLSKAQAVMLPVVFFVFDYLLRRRFDKKLIIEKAPFLLLSLIFGIIAMLAQGEMGALGEAGSFVYRIQIACYGLLSYLNKTLLPINLSAIYPYSDIERSLNIMSLSSAFIIFILSCVIFFSKRFTRKAIFGSLFFLLTILPVLQFIPVGMFFMADRYTYIPSIGIAYMFSEGLAWLYNKRSKIENILKGALLVVLIIIICVLTFLTHERAKVWKDDFTLWGDVLKKSPESTSANYYLGKAYITRGNAEEAIFYLNKALEFRINRPTSAIICYTYTNLGDAYLEKGDLDQAIYNYGRAIEIKPNNSEAYINRGVAYEKKGDFEKAISDHTKVIETKPDSATAYFNRGNAYFYKGSPDQAISDYNEAMRINPHYIEVYNNRANIYLSKQEYDKAWEDVHKIEALGYSTNPALLEHLKNASGRDR